MKRISIFLALAAVMLGFSSCSEDRDPVYQAPTKFVCNQPAMQDQYITLAEGNELSLVCSQPDYGYSAVTQYSAEMSLTEDFATVYELPSIDNTLASMRLRQTDVNLGLMELQNIASTEDFDALYSDPTKFDKVYFRAVASLATTDGTVENSTIRSNVVAYNHIRPYFGIKMPGFIYLVGAPEGWAGPTESNAAHYADWRLFEPENAIGSKIYSGTFDIAPGSAMFRFYTALTGWDADSYGSQTDDNPIEYPEYTEGSAVYGVVAGKGSFSFPNWPGGKMTVTVDMSDPNNMTLTVTAGEASVVVPRYIYVIGNLSGWMAPGLDNAEAYEAWRLVDRSESGIYSGEFTVPSGELSFRFALELTDEGWDNTTQIGSQTDDANVACQFTNGAFNGTYVSGKGNWSFNLESESTVQMTVDTNTKQVNFIQK